MIMKVIDLKNDNTYIDQYLLLRNSYVDLLLTSFVNISNTKKWIKRSDIEIRGLVQDDTLWGVVILYLRKNGEIAFFVKTPNKGVGSNLIPIIERVAKQKNLSSIWAWVLEDNMIAQHVFKKNGFKIEGTTKKRLNGIIKNGIIFRKYIL